MFNMHKAKVFIGRFRFTNAWRSYFNDCYLFKNATYLLIVAIVPIIETISVMIQVIFFKQQEIEYLK